MSAARPHQRAGPSWYRPWAIVVALVFVAVPSSFGFFPEFGALPLAVRTVVAVAWIVMAVVSVFVGARRDAHQDAQLSGLVETVSRERDLHAFRPGAGATGLAFQRKELILVTGDAVSDDTYGLTPDQQDYFAGYGAVVATPIWREGNHPIGVLSAIGEGDDGHFELSSSRAALRELADVIAVVITSVYHTEVQ